MSRWKLTLTAAAAAVNIVQPSPHAQSGPPPLSPRNASYRIDAVLDPARHEITATGHLTWHNVSRAIVSELRFHLYWNAWRDANSTWMRERRLAGGSLAGRSEEDFGNIDVSVLSIGGVNL